MLLVGANVAMAESSIKGKALYLERMMLPQNAVFKATLEDVSLMDAPSVTLGEVVISPAGQIPIAFEIKYNENDIKKGHRYSVRARITVDGKLLYITDTANFVLSGKDDNKLELIMKRIDRSGKKEKVASAPFSNFPIHFLGLLPGTNCKSQYQLDLFADKTYFIRNGCLKNGKSIQSDDIGKWHYNAEKKQLTLKGGREAPLFFSVLDSKTIEKMDHSGKAIDSKLNYKLERSYSARTLEPKIFMQGMYQYMADAALFKECMTGLKLPVLFENDNLALERAYNKDKKEAGALLKVHLEGKIVQRPKMEGEGMQAHLLVERFIKTQPNEQCGNQYVNANLFNTYWKLTALNQKSIVTHAKGREAHIIFAAPKQGKGSFKGSTGCNRLFGEYVLKADKLHFDTDKLGLTKMACSENTEEKFVAALKKVFLWKIKGDHLELMDASSTVVARFEAIYL